MAVPALLALGGTGCFRASGLQDTTVQVEAMPEILGGRVAGLKAMAGPGDYYLGNDFIDVAVDGTRFGDKAQQPISGAASGGSIVDAGYLNLDTSYQRVNIPSDSLERMTPVVNQDPSLELVFDSFVPDSTTNPATLTMTGRLLDPNHRITTITPGSGSGNTATLPVIGGPATLDSDGCVLGVKVVHTLSLGNLDRFLKMTTTITNQSGTTLGIRSVGDYVSQTSAGYRFAVPAGLDIAGNPLFQPWGIQIPGSDWGSPIATAVQANFVVLMANEPGADTVDAHATLGLMSLDQPSFMVTSDPQDIFGWTSNPLPGDKPVLPHQIAMGSLPLAPAQGVPPGGSLTYNRRLYIQGGTSATSGPNQTSTIYNLMSADRYQAATTDTELWPQDFGTLVYTLSGTAGKQGPLPTEVRIERNFGTVAAPFWIPERAEWFEPGENVTSSTTLQPASASAFLLASPSSSLSTNQVVNAAGTYRLVITNAAGTQVKDVAVNQASPFRPLLSGPIAIQPFQSFSIGGTDLLCPEANQVVSDAGTSIRSLYSLHFFSSRPADAPSGSLQPLRITVKGANGTQDPWMRRSRTIATSFSALTKAVAVSSSPGMRQIRAGNEMFGTAFNGAAQTGYFWVANGTTTGQLSQVGNPVISGGSYTAYGTRGPLSPLQSIDLLSYDGQTDTSHEFIVWSQPLPSGWTTFDMPGPGQGTTGGLLPGEKLASGMAEGVQVIGHTEQDLATDGNATYNDFVWEFIASGYTATQLGTIGNDPYVVGGRTSVLADFGTVTALFTPPATRYRFGGAIQPNNWTLADFITQAQGQFTIAHEPRGPQGIFTLGNGAPVISDPASWWNGSGKFANNATNGGLDAIELLRAEGFDQNNPDAWFTEFKAARNDWFALLNQQTPDKFTKALGLSSAKYSRDTPVGLARTYLKATPAIVNPVGYNANGTTIAPVFGSPLIQDLSSVLAALKAGAAVASTGPFLDVSVGTTGPGGLVKGPLATATLTVNLYHSAWMPVDELRIVVNGKTVTTIDPATLTQSADDSRLSTGTIQVALPVTATGTGAWIVVEAGVRLGQTGPYAVGQPWNFIMRGIYPIAVTNPIFIDVAGTGYKHP